jgi:hypothetical protein
MTHTFSPAPSGPSQTLRKLAAIGLSSLFLTTTIGAVGGLAYTGNKASEALRDKRLATQAGDITAAYAAEKRHWNYVGLFFAIGCGAPFSIRGLSIASCNAIDAAWRSGNELANS